ncbi:nuclear transport factor 2 family protein [Shewanella chilikensis]|jgi:hypothetical protein|uniref:nuclear transport factor 2 family protein n=1 Tax=Shewanella TaxID=22 RepID=UPI001F3ACD43|nr:nuclear transport factor 2 family protein [Shewanella chilikensis]MCE9851654.1 nuclear transport factor 2 family protein [Shewanella chilikensis]
MNHISDIQQLESQLRSAMLNSDINLLDRLLSPQLIFTNHLGQVLGKAEDLHAHSSGLLNITRIDTLAEEIRLHQETAIVSAEVNIQGSYAKTPANGRFRFTRVWLHRASGWQLIAAHSSLLA